jgi:hypothetical protein
MTAAGQVVVVHWLPAVAPEAAQLSTGTLLLTIGPGQVMVIQLLPALPVCGVQTCTGTEVPVRTLQAVVCHPLASVGPDGTQVPDGMVVECGVQIVVSQPLPAVPVTAVQVWTGCDALTIVGAGQVVAVQLLPAAAAVTTHEPTGTFEVLFGVQVVVVQLLPPPGPDAVQVCTPVGPVVIGAGQVVVVQLLPPLGPEAVQVWLGVLLATSGGQVVDV